MTIRPQDVPALLPGIPEPYRTTFLVGYVTAVDATARDFRCFPFLERVIKFGVLMKMSAERHKDPAYQKELEEIRNGTAKTIPIVDVLASNLGMTQQEAQDYWDDLCRKAEERRERRMARRRRR